MSTENLLLVDSLDKLKRMTDALMTHADKGGLVGFDVETGYVGPDRKKGALDVSWDRQFVCGLSLSPGRKFGAYIPLLHDLGPNLDPEKVWPLLQPLLETAPLVAHNAKFEVANCRALERKGHGPRIEPRIYADTMLDAYVLSEWGATGLKDLVLWELDHQMAHIEELFPDYTAKQHDALRFNVLELTPKVVNYAAEDALWCVRLADKIHDRAEKERPRIKKIEYGIFPLMEEVEDKGVQVDYDMLCTHEALGDEFTARMEMELKRAFSAWAGQDMSALNLGSPLQLQKLLYRDLGVKTTRLTAGAMKNPEKYENKEQWQKLSTDDVALEAASKKHPEVQMLLELRQAWNLAKRLHSWKDEYCVHYPDRRVHARYAQTTVGSGRFAAESPPIQQCPKEWRWAAKYVADVWDDEVWAEIVANGTNGKEFWTGNFRDLITSGPGAYLLTYDYSQIELRVLAGVSKESSLLEAFARGDDVHTITAAKMLGKDPADVTATERQIGKTINFGLLYQMGAKSLAERLGVSMERGKELYAMYFSSFTSITNWMDRAKSEGKRRKYIETPFGRKWRIKELYATSNAMVAKGERMLINGPIQGGAADYMKIAMLRAEKTLRQRGWWGTDVMIVMNQHDALTFEVANHLDPREVRDVLEAAVVFPVPGFPKIVADWELGQRWGSSQKWKDSLEPLWDGEKWVLGSGKGEPVPERTETIEPVVEAVAPLRLVVDDESDSSRGVRLLLTLAEMPTEEQFARMVALMNAHKGSNSVTVITPEGSVETDYMVSLMPSDQGKVALALPGARLTVAPESVDGMTLMAGLAI